MTKSILNHEKLHLHPYASALASASHQIEGRIHPSFPIVPLKSPILPISPILYRTSRQPFGGDSRGSKGNRGVDRKEWEKVASHLPVSLEVGETTPACLPSYFSYKPLHGATVRPTLTLSLKPARATIVLPSFQFPPPTHKPSTFPPPRAPTPNPLLHISPLSIFQ